MQGGAQTGWLELPPLSLSRVLPKFKSKARNSIFSPIPPVSEMVEWKRYSILKRKMSVEAKNYEGRTAMHNSAEAEIGRSMTIKDRSFHM